MHNSISKALLVNFIFNNVTEEERKKIIEAINTNPEIRERYLFEKRKFDVERYIYDEINIGERCEIEELIKTDSRLSDYFALHTEAFEQEQKATINRKNIHITKEQLVKFILNDVYDVEYIEEYRKIIEAINTNPVTKEQYLFEKRKYDIERYLEDKMDFGERCEMEELLRSDLRLHEHFELKKDLIEEQENILINLMYPTITKARLVNFILNDVNDEERKKIIEAINTKPEIKERYLFEKRINDVGKYINDEMTIGECCEIEERIKTDARLYDYFVLNTEANEEEANEEEQDVFISDEHLRIIKEQLINFILNDESEEYIGEYEKISKVINKSSVIREVYLFEKRKYDIERYLNNEMDFGERCEIEELIKIDSRLSEHFELKKDVNKFLETALKEKINNIHAKLYDTDHDNESGKIEDEVSTKDTAPVIELKHNVMRIGKWVAAASIIFMIGFGGRNMYLNNTGSLENKLYNKYYEPLKNGNYHYDNSAMLIEAKKLYSNKEYGMALMLLEEYPNSLSLESEKTLYEGLTLMELERYNEAIEKLEQVQKNKIYKPVQSTNNWYLSLCYLKIGNNEQAIAQLEKITNNNSYFYKEAKELLKKLKK
ncbi:MAG: hypothetical protein GQ564_22440 [Bacteroidales bacterium]|nr:hypothetical protein [Bacteroidales bacterium]